MSDSLPDPMLELAARADAGQKLALIAIEMVKVLHHNLGLPLDLGIAADQHINHEVVDTLDSVPFYIEKRSREIVSSLLLQLKASCEQAGVP